MSIQGTFNTAVQGMNAQAQSMTTISTNIANVATTGYKVENSHFETILNHIRPNNETFLAVKTMDSRDVSAQGQIATTDRTLDLALNGRGFMVTNTEQDGTGIWQYTRDGAMDGQAVNVGTATAPVNGTVLKTVGGAYVYGWKANADGSFTETNSLSSLTPVTYSTEADFPPKATTAIQLQANVSAATSGRQSVAVPYIDANGVSRTLTIGFNGTLNAGYNLDFTSSAGNPVTADTTTVEFGSQAQLVTPSGGKITVTISDPVNGDQVMTVDLSKTTDFADKGQITVQNVSQDGYIDGHLNNVYFNSEGVLLGSYSNGQLKPLYKLPVATFAAEDNLQAMPGNYFVQTADAGALIIRGLGTQGTSTGGTAFVAGALERSTVDLADQFSRMIITQRAYSSNAQVLRTADEMTQAIRDLKR
jgi:flagellar hook protein FlgE